MAQLSSLDTGLLPADLALLVEGREGTRTTIGCSGHEVVHLRDPAGKPGLYLKIARSATQRPLLGEKLRLEWFRPHLPVPDVLGYFVEGDDEYLLLAEVPGMHAADPSHAVDIPHLIDLLADGLRMFHSLDVAGCPFDSRLEPFLADARRRYDQGLIDESEIDSCYGNMSVRDVLEEAERNGLAEHDLVVSHGDYSLPNIIIAGGDVSGFIDLGLAGVGDRYRDLACAAWSITYNLGEKYVSAFLRAYGIEEVDEERLRYYKLLDQLL